MIELAVCSLISAGLFAIGLSAALIRRNAILMLIGLELMLNAANLNFVAYSLYGPAATRMDGLMFATFSIALAAAEAAVGLALVIAVYRHYQTTDPTKIATLKG